MTSSAPSFGQSMAQNQKNFIDGDPRDPGKINVAAIAACEHAMLASVVVSFIPTNDRFRFECRTYGFIEVRATQQHLLILTLPRCPTGASCPISYQANHYPGSAFARVSSFA
jgi:hypothetical protein